MYIKSFGGQKGGSSEPPRTPTAYEPAFLDVRKQSPIATSEATT